MMFFIEKTPARVPGSWPCGVAVLVLQGFVKSLFNYCGREFLVLRCVVVLGLVVQLLKKVVDNKDEDWRFGFRIIRKERQQEIHST